jgi:tRNA-splicing endonuclease subunit Sen2
MFSFLFNSNDTKPNRKGQKRGFKDPKRRAYYSDPLPIPSPPPFNILQPSTYSTLLFPPPPTPYVATWCEATRSVNVRNDADAVDIWRRGMWGKGTLSRSQPAWRERKTAEMRGGGRVSLEGITALKRKERAEFKEERARREREEIERRRQLEKDKESGTIVRDEQALANGTIAADGQDVGNDAKPETAAEPNETDDQPKRKKRKRNNKVTVPSPESAELPVYDESYLDKETLQLAPEEALFLLNLNLLQIYLPSSTTPLTLSEFLHLIATPRPDDPFLVHYIVYYHFRRARKIVKTGLKFGVDYLLYDAPLPFTHAEHCVIVLGSYHLWNAVQDRLVKERVTWQEVNMWQRLMGNVRKKLKLVWVEIPKEGEGDWRDVKTKEAFDGVLGRYRIREIQNSRMVISRERDVKPEKTSQNNKQPK